MPKNPDRTELVFGVVSPVGCDLPQLEKVLAAHIKRFGYSVNTIKVSQFLGQLRAPSIGVKLRFSPEYHRIRTHMDAGDRVRELTNRGDILALHAASEINSKRIDEQPLPETAHLVLSLKHPDEVSTLRRIYGPGFFLIGLYTPKAERQENLVKRDMTTAQAMKLIERDREDSDPLGQQTRETFHQSDVFLSLDRKSVSTFDLQVERFVDLVFGNPFLTPTPSEHAMFLAFAAALRSADLSRQVGAVVVSAEGEVISTGANDVPKSGGGLYWPGAEDKRDFVLGKDSNKVEIERIAQDILTRAQDGNNVKRPTKSQLESAVKSSRLQDLTEFGRAVHAEMEAILSAARSGVTIRRGILYSTTFPCHNCAKHIVAAGIQRVYYVEPYPKSLAADLHPDSILVDEEAKNRVCFLPFTGVGARRFFDLFSMKVGSGRRIKRKAPDGVNRIEWDRKKQIPRVPLTADSYIERELVANLTIRDTIQKGKGE